MKLYTKLCTKLLYRASVGEPSYAEPSYAEPSHAEPWCRAVVQSRVEPPYAELCAELRAELRAEPRAEPE